VAGHLGTVLSEHEERDFEDGEHKSRPLVNVRGKDVFVVQSLHGDDTQSVNDKLCRLLFFIGALRDASSDRITAAVPYLCYARKDRKTKPRDPVTTRYLAALLEAVGTDRVFTMDVHNLAAYQNAFRCNSDHLEARKLFAAFFAERLEGSEIAVVSPDVGGVKRAERFREALEAATGKAVSNAFMEKQRSWGVVSGEAFVGDVEGRAAIIIDDLISTGTTMRRAAKACLERGSTKVFAAATHGVFTSKAGDVLGDPAFEGVVITNTVPPLRLDPALVKSKLQILDASRLFATAIERIHDGGSLTDLMEV
jgi:ribose-phosphate pyrophosphokinase